MTATHTQSAASLTMTTALFALVVERNWVAALDCVATFAAAEFKAAIAAEPAVDLDDFDPVAALLAFDRPLAERAPGRAAAVAEAVVGLDFVVDQMTAARDDKAAKAADWAAREYKKNTKKVTVGDPDRIGDYPWARPSTTLEVGYINENRRSLKVEGYLADVVELEGYLAAAADMKADIEAGHIDADLFFARTRKTHEERSGW